MDLYLIVRYIWGNPKHGVINLQFVVIVIPGYATVPIVLNMFMYSYTLEPVT